MILILSFYHIDILDILYFFICHSLLLQGATGLELNARDTALCKALYASCKILKHELESMGSAINQNLSLEFKESPNVAFLMEKWNDQILNVDGRNPRVDESWSQDVADSLKVVSRPCLLCI